MPHPWTALFQLNRTPLLALNLQDITQPLADRAPAAGLNSISWILAHLVTYRRETLAVVQDAPFTPALSEPRSLEELLAALDEVQAALAKAFDAVQDWSSARSHPALPAATPLDQLVGAFLVHEAYHIGQIAVARRLLGLPGVLKDPKELAHA